MGGLLCWCMTVVKRWVDSGVRFWRRGGWIGGEVAFVPLKGQMQGFKDVLVFMAREVLQAITLSENVRDVVGSRFFSFLLLRYAVGLCDVPCVLDSIEGRSGVFPDPLLRECLRLVYDM